MLSPKPPPPRLDIDMETSSNSRKNAPCVFAVYFAGAMLAASAVALYLAFGTNGVSEVTGAAGSTPGKLLNKLKSQSQIKEANNTQYDVMAVRNGTQEVPLDRKVLWSGSREKAGAELGSVNGQNSRSCNGSENEEIYNNQQTIQQPNKTAHNNDTLHKLMSNGKNIPISQKANKNLKNGNGLPPLMLNLNKKNNGIQTTNRHKNCSIPNFEHPLVPNLNSNGNKSKNNPTNQKPNKKTQNTEWEHPLVQISSSNGKQSTNNITKQPDKNSRTSAYTFEHTLAPASNTNGKLLNQPQRNGWKNPLVVLTSNGKTTSKNITIPIKTPQNNIHPLVPALGLNGKSSNNHTTQPLPDRNPKNINWASPSPIVPTPSAKKNKLSNFPINHPSNKNPSPNSRWLPIIPGLSPNRKKPNMQTTNEKP